MVRRVIWIVGSFLLASITTAQVGSVLRSLKIGDQAGGLGTLSIGDFFGGSLAAMGDLDGDGIGDLAVGGSATIQSFWTLMLRSDGSVRSQNKIGPLGPFFGWRLATVGDLDGDGIGELATTSTTGVWILFLNPDGTLRSQTQTLFSHPLFVPATDGSRFESGAVCGLGDLDGDGIGDLAVGSPLDPDVTPFWGMGALWILRLNADGSLKAAQKISGTRGGFAGSLGLADLFGYEVMLLGDLDSNGSPEIGVGSPNANGSRRMWVLSLAPDGNVLGQIVFGSGDYTVSVRGTTIFMDQFDALGDLDGDGLTEVAMGFPRYTLPRSPVNTGGFAIGFLRTDGRVKKRLVVGHRRGGFGDLTTNSLFGWAFAPLGDLDGDGAREIAVGAPGDRNRGAVWILSLDPSAIRNGSGVNPQILSQASDPLVGTTWSATLDCTGHAPGVAAVWGYSAPTSGVFTPYGEVLVSGRQKFDLVRQHAGGPTLFQGNIPPRVSLIDLSIFIQGACTGRPGARLSNALDVLVGF